MTCSGWVTAHVASDVTFRSRCRTCSPTAILIACLRASRYGAAGRFSRRVDGDRVVVKGKPLRCIDSLAMAVYCACLDKPCEILDAEPDGLPVNDRRVARLNTSASGRSLPVFLSGIIESACRPPSRASRACRPTFLTAWSGRLTSADPVYSPEPASASTSPGPEFSPPAGALTLIRGVLRVVEVDGGRRRRRHGKDPKARDHCRASRATSLPGVFPQQPHERRHGNEQQMARAPADIRVLVIDDVHEKVEAESDGHEHGDRGKRGAPLTHGDPRAPRGGDQDRTEAERDPVTVFVAASGSGVPR